MTIQSPDVVAFVCVVLTSGVNERECNDPLLMGLIGRVNGRLGGVETITVRGGGDSEVKIGTKPQSLRTRTSQSLLMAVKTGLHSHGLG